MSRKYSDAAGSPFPYLLSLWPAVLLAPLVPFPTPLLLSGHPWKAELVISAILSVVCAFVLFKAGSRTVDPFATGTAAKISVSMLLFILWSGFSLFWASSPESVVHHTLVWAAYLIFFVFALYVVSDRRLLRLAFISLGVIASIICATCAIEYLVRDGLDSTFGFRYARFAEIWAALLPLFLSFALRLKRKHLMWSSVSAALLWTAILFSTSRASLAAALAGITVFCFLRFFATKVRSERKRLAAAVFGLALVAVLTQIPPMLAADGQKSSTLTRIAANSETDAGNSLARNIRFLFYSVGMKMAQTHPVVGVGTDNFGLEFNKYRAIVSADAANRPIAAGNEDAIPERAHNEYLQIVSELGIVGGLIFLFFLFAVFRAGFIGIRKGIGHPDNILTHAAAAGMVAFLISSAFSSFSFRLVQNGVVFFFLAALLVRSSIIKDPDRKGANVPASRLQPDLLAFCLLACLSLAIFSGLKAAGQYMVYSAERESDVVTANAKFNYAIRFDAANAGPHYSYGLVLLSRHNFADAAVQFRQVINKGAGTSVNYSYLMSSYNLANNSETAISAASEAVSVFPYSVFLRTRYAVLMSDAGRHDDANAQFAIAKSINEKQAQTWRLLITQGSRPTYEASRSDTGIAAITDLYPAEAVYAVLAERQIKYPDEKFKMPE